MASKEEKNCICMESQEWRISFLMLVAWNGGRTGSSGKVFKHSVGDSSTEKPTTSRDSEGDAAAALSPDMSPGDGEPLVSSP